MYEITFPRANFPFVSLFRGLLGKSEEHLFCSIPPPFALSFLLSLLAPQEYGIFLKSLQLTWSHKTVLLECFHTLVSLLSPLVLPALFYLSPPKFIRLQAFVLQQQVTSSIGGQGGTMEILRKRHIKA